MRGYQGLGGTVGLPGVLEEPAAVRRASLAAGAAILLAGLACLALVRPWGLRLPRRLIVVTALAGAVIAVTHALIAYVSKPLHLLGAIDLEFKGWIEIDETQAILWDLLFYEPWFLGLGVLVTIAAGHHHRRAGGGEREWRGLVVGAAGVTAVWAAVSCVAEYAGHPPSQCVSPHQYLFGFSRMEIPRMHRFFDRARSAASSRKRCQRCCLPTISTASAPRETLCRG